MFRLVEFAQQKPDQLARVGNAEDFVSMCASMKLTGPADWDRNQ